VARTDSPIVKVEEEVEHVKNYVSLINMRFDDKIQFYWNIDDNVLDYQIIRLSIQPIIENAIFHGIYPLDGIGIIEINCYKDNDYLYVNVSDDGCGIGKQNLNDLIKNINEQDAKNSIGLHNIQSRIKLYFGEEYGIEITSKVNAGTSVTIKLPLRLYKDESTPASEIQDI
jgi:two-component system sensor histidine kinase YesM